MNSVIFVIKFSIFKSLSDVTKEGSVCQEKLKINLKDDIKSQAIQTFRMAAINIAKQFLCNRYLPNCNLDMQCYYLTPFSPLILILIDTVVVVT